MKTNIFLKIMLIFLVIFNLAFPVMANSQEQSGTGEAVKPEFDIGKFEESVSVPSTLNNLTNDTLGTAISVARIAGVGIAIVILIVIGCKYMMAAPGDRADIKKNAIPYVIGAVVLFGTTGLLGIIADVAKVISVS